MLKPTKRIQPEPKHGINPWMIYLTVFGLTLHATPALYVNSSFLETVLSQKTVGLIYSLASILTIFAFLFVMTKSLKRFGNYKTFLGTLLAEFGALALLAIAPSTPLIIFAFVIHFISTAVAFMSIDIFLEEGSSDKTTGGVRGILLSTSSVAFVVGPLISGKILESGAFWIVYVLGMIILSLVIFGSMMKLSKFKDPVYNEVTKDRIVSDVFVHKNVYFAMQVGFILRFFYAWMVIYSPIFLRGLGFDWSQTGLILAIGLIPFIFLEAPLGILADKFHAERSQMSVGFVIMSVSCFVIYFSTEITSVLIWALIIFTSRVGAAFLEVASESYIFKNIKSDDLAVLTFFRTMRPIAYVIAPILASILIPYIGIKGLFLVLGVYLIYGLRYSLVMKKM